MTHLPILPILVAALAGFTLLLMQKAPLAAQRLVSLLAAVGALGVAALLFVHSLDGAPQVYALADWAPPYGIVLVPDRLGAMMVLLAAVTGATALFAASFSGPEHGTRWDAEGGLFHPLFHFQMMGIYGAFLTGDIFNLFVFFEVLLIASYGLLLHGGGPERGRAGVKYVVINLAASALFLVAVGMLYGVTGTLNMADLAVSLRDVPAEDAGLVRAGALLFLVVFGTKAALGPMMFWLPDSYSAATPPVASLFAIMTKIGVYAILRVYSLSFAPLGGGEGAFIAPWLMGAALFTLLAGTMGAVASRRLRRVVAYLNIASVGTMLVAVAVFTEASIRAALYYLVHSTLTIAALFLLAGPIMRGRSRMVDRLHAGPPLASGARLGLAFMGLALAVAGLPPLSGFLGKAMILQSAIGHANAPWIWTVILVTSLFMLVTLGRAASVLFWKTERGIAPGGGARAGDLAPVWVLLGLLAALTVLAGPFDRFAHAVAADLLSSDAYIDAVLGATDPETRL